MTFSRILPRELQRIDDETEYLRYVYNATKYLSKALVRSPPSFLFFKKKIDLAIVLHIALRIGPVSSLQMLGPSSKCLYSIMEHEAETVRTCRQSKLSDNRRCSLRDYLECVLFCCRHVAWYAFVHATKQKGDFEDKDEGKWVIWW